MGYKCKIVGIFTLILGIFATVVIAYNYYHLASGYSEALEFFNQEAESNDSLVMNTVAISCTGLFITISLSMLFFALSEIAGNTEMIMDKLSSLDEEDDYTQKITGDIFPSYQETQSYIPPESASQSEQDYSDQI